MHIAILCISAVAICTERVEAKSMIADADPSNLGCNLHGACGGKGPNVLNQGVGGSRCNLHGACGGKEPILLFDHAAPPVAICTERVEAKNKDEAKARHAAELQSARSVWRQSACCLQAQALTALQSARSVWRQSGKVRCAPGERMVAICTERVEAKRKIRTYLVTNHVAICTERVEAKIIA